MDRGCSSMVELQPSKLAMRVRFPSPAPVCCIFSIYCLFSCHLVRPTVSVCIPFEFVLLKDNFRTELGLFEKLVELPAVLPKMQAVLKLAIQTRSNPFAPVSHSSVTPRDTRMAMTLTWLQGFPTAVTLMAPSGPD